MSGGVNMDHFWNIQIQTFRSMNDWSMEMFALSFWIAFASTEGPLATFWVMAPMKRVNQWHLWPWNWMRWKILCCDSGRTSSNNNKRKQQRRWWSWRWRLRSCGFWDATWAPTKCRSLSPWPEATFTCKYLRYQQEFSPPCVKLRILCDLFFVLDGSKQMDVKFVGSHAWCQWFL